jgi:hypothetical protein
MSSSEGIGEFTPRQLAPSVGTTGAGIPFAMVSTPAIYRSSTAEDLICFGSFYFMPHSMAQLPLFSDLRQDMDLTFGAFRFRASTRGIMRLPDMLRSRGKNSGTISATSLDSSTSSVGSSNDPPVILDAIYCNDCDATHHVPNGTHEGLDVVDNPEEEGGYGDSTSSAISTCLVQVCMANT